MPKYGLDQLILEGRMQFDTALDALEANNLELPPYRTLKRIDFLANVSSSEADRQSRYIELHGGMLASTKPTLLSASNLS